MKKDKIKSKKNEENGAASAICNDKRCPLHGQLSVRGRKFKGQITSIYLKNAAVEFERFVYVPKYERYAKTRTKLHAHVPDCMAEAAKEGTIVEIGECRPLSKTIHYVITRIIEGEKKK